MISVRAGTCILASLASSTGRHTASTQAFGETLQFITDVKLRELEKRSERFNEHVENVHAKAKEKEDKPVDKLAILVEGMKSWLRGWSSNWSRLDVEHWIEQARRKPNFPESIVQSWISKSEAEYEHKKLRYDYAHLFGNHLPDWLKSSKQSADLYFTCHPNPLRVFSERRSQDECR